MTGTATVADAPLTATAKSITATEGAPFSGLVATFTDADPNGTLGDYSATITWSSGNSSTGTITYDSVNQVYDVSGGTTFAEEGTYAPSVLIRDGGGATITATDTATVADAALSGSGVNQSPPEGTTLTAVVANFSDADPAGTASDYSATVTWGDGHSSPGTIAYNTSTHSGTVTATDSFGEEGSVYNGSVAITDSGGSHITLTFTTTVVDATPVVTSASNLSGNEGQTLSFTGAFTDTGTLDTHTATINWGDGTSSAGTVTESSGSGTVAAIHVYADGGTYAITLKVSDNNGVTGSRGATATILDVAPTVTATTVTAVVNQALTNVQVASFTSPGFTFAPAGTTETFTATINWGDGTATTPGIVAVTEGSTGVLTTGTVSGTHTYTIAGTYTLSVTVVDDALSKTASQTVVVPAHGPTKFHVVDDTADDFFNYDAYGNLISSTALSDPAPRGSTSNAAGTTIWVVDANDKVYVYNASGVLQGSWTATGITQPTDLATDGTNLWIVDKSSDAIDYYAGAASRTSGTQAPTSSFALAANDTSPSGLTTNGSSLWVTDDATTTSPVFVYSTAGALLGSWSLDPGESNPTGITLNPSGGSDLWVVDQATLRVYHYAGATAWLSGSYSATDTFPMAAADTHPTGIDDPFNRQLGRRQRLLGRGDQLDAGVPTSSTAVSLDETGGPWTITVRSGSQAALSIQDTLSNTLAITGGSLSVGSSSSLHGPLSVSGGTLTLASGVTLTAQSVNSLWSGGTLSGAGTLSNTGTMTISGASGETLSGATLANVGTVNWTGAGNLNFQSGATINNHAGAVFDINSNAIVASSLSGDTSTLSFLNAGTLAKLSGTGATAFGYGYGYGYRGRSSDGVVLTSSGTVDVASGTLAIGTGGTDSGPFVVSSGATLAFFGGSPTLTSASSLGGAGKLAITGGTATFGGSDAITNLNVNGTTAVAIFNTAVTIASPSAIQNGTATFNKTATIQGGTISGGTATFAGGATISGALTWSGGTIGGTVAVPTTGTLTLSGTSSETLAAATLTNAGTVNWTGSGNLDFQSGSTINNQAGGVFDITSNATVASTLSGDTSTLSFLNAGTLEKLAGTGATAFGYGYGYGYRGRSGTDGVVLTSSGTVDVATGTLAIGTGGTDTGTFITASGATLAFFAGSPTLTAAATVSDQGTLAITGGTATFDCNISPGILKIATNGTATFNGAVTVAFASLDGTGTFNAAVAIDDGTFFEPDGHLQRRGGDRRGGVLVQRHGRRDRLRPARRRHRAGRQLWRDRQRRAPERRDPDPHRRRLRRAGPRRRDRQRGRRPVPDHVRRRRHWVLQWHGQSGPRQCRDPDEGRGDEHLRHRRRWHRQSRRARQLGDGVRPVGDDRDRERRR